MLKFYKDVKVIEHPLNDLLGDDTYTQDSISLKNLSKALKDKPFYGITLNDRVIKTIYKDDLMIASKPLADSLAKEWDSQTDSFNPSSLRLNTLVSKAVRSQ